MSEEPQQVIQEDIFKYDPITEWNNLVIEFGMPSTDGNLRLTEICLAAESCLEASNNATKLSFTDYLIICQGRSQPHCRSNSILPLPKGWSPHNSIDWDIRCGENSICVCGGVHPS